MSETRYLISEAARITQVEAHVLRYWEEELGLSIGRNKMGHRYYTDKDIRTFMNIKELKKKGLQLRAIREIISEEKVQEEKGGEDLPRVIVMRPQVFQRQEDSRKAPEPDAAIISGDGENQRMGKEDRKGKQPEEREKKAAGGSGKSQVPKEMIPKDKHEEENKEISPMPEMATSRDETAAAGFEIKEKQFEKIMERLIRQLENGEKKEERYRRLDAAIRRHQQSRKMAAATEENSRKRKKRNKKKS